MFSNFRINQFIIHEIYKRVESNAPLAPLYGSQLIQLDGEGMATLRERISQAIGSNSNSVELEIVRDQPGSLFDATATIFGLDTAAFVERSRFYASKLAEAQISRKIPGGIVVVLRGTTGAANLPYLCIIKAEIQSGFSRTISEDTLRLEYLSDLLLTPQQKLYKIAIFVKTGSAVTKNDFKAFVFDQNMNRAETQQLAKYFFEGFMGCGVAPSNKKLTQDFFNITNSFIGNLPIEEQEKLDLDHGLYTYLKVSRRTLVDPAEFAEEYLDDQLKDSYLEHLQSEGFVQTAFVKDLSYIKNKLQRKVISFSSCVRITSPSERFNELVKITEQSDQSTVVEIQGRVLRDRRR